MRTVQWRESYRWTMAVIKRHDFTRMLGNITDFERWCTQACQTKADLRFDGLRRRHRMSDGVGPCCIEHAVEDGGADDGFGASRRIAAGSHAIADDGLVAVAVGTRIAPRPPHRSVRAALPHTAPALSHDAKRSLGYG